MDQNDVDNINTLGKFCGQRDFNELSLLGLRSFGLKQADVFVLFGGSILYGVDILAQAIQNKIAKKYVIVGGYGHTTATLQQTVMHQYPDIPANQMQESEIFAALLKQRFNLQVDYLETQSTNCGNNITYLLELLHQHQIDFKSIILAQDATMQRRMSACLVKYIDQDIQVLNYATYQVTVQLNHDQLTYDHQIPGMWQPQRYLTLLMGEIPRLTDNKTGYGPQGQNFISHVDIPQNVQKAYQALKSKYPDINRPKNDQFA